MKKVLTLLSVFATLFVLAPVQAEARSYSHGTTVYVSGHTSCGCPIYTKKVFRYHDCRGNPVYAYYRMPVNHKCQHRNNHYRPVQKPSNQHYRNNQYYRNNYYRHNYNRGNSCNSNTRYYYRNGVRVSYTYRR